MGLQVFHAGTALKDGSVVSSGGRVLTVTSVRSDLEAALQAANRGVAAVGFPGAVYRRDIAHRAIAHLNQNRSVWMWLYSSDNHTAAGISRNIVSLQIYLFRQQLF